MSADDQQGANLEQIKRDRDFYRERVLAAHKCACRWLFNADQTVNFKGVSRRSLSKQCAHELLEAIGAVRPREQTFIAALKGTHGGCRG